MTVKAKTTKPETTMKDVSRVNFHPAHPNPGKRNDIFKRFVNLNGTIQEAVFQLHSNRNFRKRLVNGCNLSPTKMVVYNL